MPADREKSKELTHHSISGNSISNASTNSGDIFNGIKNNFNFEAPKVDPTLILQLVEKYKNIDCESAEFVDMKEELDNYNKPRPNREIIGLSNKLEAGVRKDLIEDAIYYKDMFAKRLSKHEFSPCHSVIHYTFICKIEEKFNSLIVPLIKENNSNSVIDQAISNMIIQPLADEIALADPTLNAKQIRGMLYLLTGNCYVKWSKS